MSEQRILLAIPELTPLAPVGGIAEYVLGLATALKRRGHDVRVALPSFAYLSDRPDTSVILPRFVVPLGVGATQVGQVRETRIECPGEPLVHLPVFLFGAHPHFATVTSPGQVYSWPNHEPWLAFSWSVVEFLAQASWKPDVVHCQDSHTAMIPVYLRHLRRANPKAAVTSVTTVLTIHNLLNQGKGPRELLAYGGLEPESFERDGFEFYGQANCFKAGLLAADQVTTVSRTYGDEIRRSPAFGFGLEGVLEALPRFTGIVNVID
jgi:starch synthase